MGREQNTSPSRGSGYQVINDLFDRQQDPILKVQPTKALQQRLI